MSSISLTLGLRGRLLSGTQVTLQGTLFGNNEPGFTFEPWDITTLYRDRAGTTPVTAAGQSVGLRLSKDQGLRQGPEVNPDPGFDNPAAWTFGGATPGWAVTGGKAECTATAGANRWVSIPNLLTVGATYLITADVIVTSGGCVPDVSANAAGDATTSGTKRWIVTASTSTLQFIGRSNFIGSIDNVSFKTLAGNHEVAVSDAKRGVYGWMPKTGRRNLLTYTEQFGATSSFFVQTNVTTADNSVTAPNGTTTAARLTTTAVSGQHRIYQSSSSWPSQVAVSLYAKADTASALQLLFTVGGGNIFATYNLATGAVSHTSANATSSITNVGDGWYRCVLSHTVIGTTGNMSVSILEDVATGNLPVPVYLGTGKSILIWGAQLETGSTATAYQRVVSQYDITEAGVPTCYYVQADGVDDAYVTPTITPNTDKVQVFAGVRKLSDATTGALLESSVDAGSNAGTILLLAPDANASPRYGFYSRGSVASGVASSPSSSFAAPISNVVTGIGDISADVRTIRINASSIGTSSSDQGTGNYLAYPAYIYARGGTSLPFNGLDFGHAVRFGPNLDAATIARVEALIARNTPEVDFMFGGVWTDQYNWDDETNWNDGV